MRCRLLAAFILAAASCHAAPTAMPDESLSRLQKRPDFRSLPQLAQLQAAASKGLSQYRLLVNPENFRSFGLTNVQEAEGASLGIPTRDYLVRLDALKRYRSNGDPNALLTDTKIVHYPIVVQDRTCGAVSVGQQGGAWQVLSVGDADRTVRLESVFAESSKAENRTKEQYFIVRIPALNLQFAAHRDQSKTLFLTPLDDISEWSLKTGGTERADGVFARLAPIARAHNGLPR